MRAHIITHLKNNEYLSKKYIYSFISGKFTPIQHLLVLEKLNQDIDNRYEIDSIYLDFTKAFDTIPHARFLKIWSIYYK